MAKEIFMPKLSSTMSVGTLLQWFKEEGDSVSVGDPLFEIMTDKINIEVEAYEEGTLIKRYYKEDDEVPVNHVIGYIGDSNESVPDHPPGSAEGNSEATSNSDDNGSAPSVMEEERQSVNAFTEKPRVTPAARRVAKQKGIGLQEVPGSGPKGRIHVADVVSYSINHASPKATPLAKKLAHAQGVNLSGMQGSGTNGKILKQDVEGSLASPVTTTQPVQQVKRTVKLDGMRKVIAKRMAESAYTAPHVTLNSEIDMSKAIEIRKQLLGKIEKQTGFRLSYTEIILKAVAQTLKNHPIINASLQGDEIVFHDEVNIGLAVAVDNGLVVPVIKHADLKGLAALTEECKTLGNAARENKLTPAQFSGGTFTISNLGMYAVDTFTPIINQPELAILGVGRIVEKPVGINGAIVLRPMMGVSLSFDHRVIDGAPAAAFLTDLKTVLENPFELLI